MEGRGVNHGWYMGVVSHSYDGLGGVDMEVVVGEHAGRSQEVLVACREMAEHFQLMTPPSRFAAWDRVEPELVSLPGKAPAY